MEKPKSLKARFGGEGRRELFKYFAEFIDV